MAPCRRPIDRTEVSQLTRLGESLRVEREARGRTVLSLAGAAAVSDRHLRRLQRGERRTRRSTLMRLASALEPRPELAESLVGEWVALAGAALAPESEYAERVERRRTRRQRQRRAHPPVKVHVTEYYYTLPGCVVERHERRRRIGKRRQEVSVAWRVTTPDGARVKRSHEASLLRTFLSINGLDL